MIPCKFFLKGTCRFGDNCRFPHPQTQNEQYNPNVFGGQRQANPGNFSNYATNNYAQNSYASPNYIQQQQHRNTKYDDNLKAVEEAVKRDMIEWERGKIWPFSAYGPIGGKPNLPGFEDFSAEELRYATMMNNGQPPPEVAMRFSQWNGYRSSYQVTNPANTQLLRQISSAQPQQSIVQPVSPSFQPASNVASIFGGNQSSSSFGGGATAFGSPVQSQMTSQQFGMNPNPNPAFPTMGSNFFGLNKGPTVQNEQMKEIGAASSSASLSGFSFNQVLSQTQQQPQQPSAFGQGPFSSNTPLGQNPAPQFGAPPFSFQNQPSQIVSGNTMSSPFNSGGSSFPTSNPVFGMQQQIQQPVMMNNPVMNQNIFGGGGSGGSGDAIEEDFSIYSKDTELTDLEIRAYEHTTFDIQNLPLHAPSKRFCC